MRLVRDSGDFGSGIELESEVSLVDADCRRPAVSPALCVYCSYVQIRSRLGFIFGSLDDVCCYPAFLGTLLLLLKHRAL